MKTLYQFNNNEFVAMAKNNTWTDTALTPETAIIFFTAGEENFEYTDDLSFLRNPEVLVINASEVDSFSLATRIAIISYIRRWLGQNFMISAPIGSNYAKTIVKYILDAYPDMYDASSLRRGAYYDEYNAEYLHALAETLTE